MLRGKYPPIPTTSYYSKGLRDVVSRLLVLRAHQAPFAPLSRTPSPIYHPSVLFAPRPPQAPSPPTPALPPRYSKTQPHIKVCLCRPVRRPLIPLPPFSLQAPSPPFPPSLATQVVDPQKRASVHELLASESVAHRSVDRYR